MRVGIASAGIGVFAGLLSVGPGFLLLLALILFGYTARLAATNSVIVTLPSFSAFATHLVDARFGWLLLALTSVAAVIGAPARATFMANRVKSLTLSRVFATALVLLAAQRIWLLVV